MSDELIYDERQRLFVVDPASVHPGPELAERVPAELARRYGMVPLGFDPSRNRLLLGMADPRNAMAREAASRSGALPVVVRLHVRGGPAPTWAELDNPQHGRVRLAWEPEEDDLLDRAYGAPTAPGEPMLRFLAHILGLGYPRLWLLPRAKCMVLLAEKDGVWVEVMSPSRLLRRDILHCLRERAGQGYEVTFESGRHGIEAFLTVKTESAGLA